MCHSRFAIRQSSATEVSRVVARDRAHMTSIFAARLVPSVVEAGWLGWLTRIQHNTTSDGSALAYPFLSRCIFVVFLLACSVPKLRTYRYCYMTISSAISSRYQRKTTDTTPRYFNQYKCLFDHLPGVHTKPLVLRYTVLSLAAGKYHTIPMLYTLATPFST